MKNFLVFVFIFFSACKNTDLNLTIPYEGDKLVLWGKLKAGEPLRIQVTKSFNAVGVIPDDITIPNATVVLFKNGKQYVTLSYSADEAGIYVSDSLVEAGATYIVKASAPTLPEAESMPVLVPAELPEVTIQRTRNVPSGIDQDFPQDLLNLYFTEQSRQTEQYFTLLLINYYTKDTTSTSLNGTPDNMLVQEEDCHTWATEKILSPRIDPISGLMNTPKASVFLMNSKCLPSPEIPVAFYIYSQSFKTPPETALRTDLKIGVTTKEAFDYAKLEYDQPEGLDLLVLPPQRAITNIKNGYGLISASNEKTITIP